MALYSLNEAELLTSKYSTPADGGEVRDEGDNDDVASPICRRSTIYRSNGGARHVVVHLEDVNLQKYKTARSVKRIFGEHHGGGDCEAGLRRGERSRPR